MAGANSPGTPTYISPADIRFTQDSISEEFGRDNSETLERTFEELINGETDVTDIRPMTVVLVNGLYWVTSGNRRLYVFKKLEECGRINSVQVNVKPVNMGMFHKIKTTKNEGTSVTIRQDRLRGVGDKLNDRLNRICELN